MSIDRRDRPPRRISYHDTYRMTGGESWKQKLSGLRPMTGWRAEQVERQIAEAQGRRGA